ncbi:MAG: SprT family zinc-dependent metalloprotease [Wenzhouxiangellaceae bacterium]
MKTSRDKQIPYKVVRSRRSTADIIIERDGSVLVRAPEWVDDDQVASIVESKHYWIYQGLAEWRDLNATRTLREYKNGEGFLYLGRAYRLLLVSDQDQALQLKNGRFTLRRDLVEKGEITAAKQAFRDFYITKGMERLCSRVDYYAPKVGVDPTKVEVKELGNRWATCSTAGKLSFHWKCMMAPPTIIDYMVVHELCHFHHRDHTNAFWNEVDKIISDYRERKAWLRDNGAGLDI